MAYSGYLIKVGNYTIPHSLIALDTYHASCLVMDLDSYRDSNGTLHRNALSNRSIKIEFETKNQLTNTEFATLMSNIRSQYTNSSERKLTVKAYIPELDKYVEQACYMPNISSEIYIVDDSNGTLRYNSVRLAFIGYGGTV